LNEENSKLMSGVGSHGLRASLRLAREMSTDEIRNRLEEIIMRIARLASGDGERAIGHIKAFVRMGDGHLKISVVDLDLGTETIDSLEEGATAGSINLMAAIFGLDDDEIEEIMELELGRSRDIEFSIEHHDHEQRREKEVD